MSKLLSQGGFGCVFYPGVKCDGTSNPDKKVVTKIQEDNFNARNEDKIGEKIENIPNYKLYFLPVISSCPINIRKIDRTAISKCEIIKENTNYVAMDIDYINTVNFTDVLQNVTSKRLLLLLYQTYKYLLNALKLLQEKSIVHYDLKLDNLLFVKSTNQPRIIDYGISIPMDDVTQKNMKDYFYVFAPEYYIWCIEINMINYFIHEKRNTLTEREMKIVVDLTIHNNPILQLKKNEIVEEYRKKAYDYYKQFIGMDSQSIIKKLKEHYKSWDNYSLSVLLTSLINKLFDRDEDKNPYILGLEKLMLRNIHPDPSKRLTVAETSSKLDEVLYEDGSVSSYLSLSNNIKKDKRSISVQIKREEKELRKFSR